MDFNGTAKDQAWLEEMWAHRAQVVRYLARIVADPNAVEDLAQQTFVEAWQKRSQEPRYPLAWLYGIARNLAADHWRAMQRGRSAWQKLCADPLCDDGGVGYSELWRDVLAACQSMTNKERECLLLSFHDGFSDVEIASILRTSRENVRQQRHRARMKLQRALARGDDLERAGRLIRARG
ncbi:MAG TPA: RNA polymerase sigma factor [Rugosimonospora sp.]|nr:RNA polymerase sigma factor [Rugosimonospora sp.]